MTCGHSPFVTVFNTFIAGLRQHRSVAVGGSNVQFEPHNTVLFVAQVRTGGVVSTIVTVSLQVFVLPQQSRASQIRVMNCGQVPFVNVPNTETPWRQQLSVATGVPNSHETIRKKGAPSLSAPNAMRRNLCFAFRRISPGNVPFAEPKEFPRAVL